MINLADIDLKSLRVFDTIVKCGGFSAAQAALNSSQSSISEQMSHLEARLGVKLCQRGRSGFRLTKQGHAIHQATQRLLSAVEDFCMDADEVKQRISGTLNLGIIDSTITNPNSPVSIATQRFVARGHDVHLNIYIGTPSALEERVLDHRLHLAIGHFPLRISGIAYQSLFTEESQAYCGKHHSLYQTTLQGDALATAIHGCHVAVRSYQFKEDLSVFGVSRSAATVDNIEAMAILILSGAYLGLLPTHFSVDWVARGELYPLDILKRDASLTQFEVITKRARVVPPIMQAFLADLLG